MAPQAADDAGWAVDVLARPSVFKLTVQMQMRDMGHDALKTVVTSQHMWQALIEACCRSSHPGVALKVQS